MEDRTYTIIAVVFLILTTAGGLFVFWWMQSGPSLTKDYVIDSSHSISGLKVKAPVKYKGVKVGSVSSVELDPQNLHKVRISIRLVAKAPVSHDTYAQLATKGITGLKYVSLQESGGSEAPLHTSRTHPARIPLHRSLVHKLEKSGKTVLQQTKHVSKQLSELLSAGNRTHIKHILAHLDQATGRLVALERSAGKTLKKVDKDATAVDHMSRSTEAVARKLRTDTLPRMDKAAGNFDRTLTTVHRLARELRRHPSSVVFGAPSPAKPGPGKKGFHPPAAPPGERPQ